MALTNLLMAVLLAARAVTAQSSVALSDFIPRIDSLAAPCSTVYNQAIQGCVAADFDTSKQRCSAGCVQGLVTISQAISRSCSLNDVSETSLIGVFLLGQGIPILCVGVSVTTVGASSLTTTTSTSTSTSAAAIARSSSTQGRTSQSSSAARSTLATSATSATNAGASTLTQTTATTSTSAQPSFSWSLPTGASTAAPTPAQTSSSQKSNSDSGGGSPFDVVATGSGSSPPSPLHQHTGLTGAILGMAVLACVLL